MPKRLLAYAQIKRRILQAVDDLADVGKDAVEVAEAVDVVVDALLGVPLNEGLGLGVLDAEALLDGLLVVVGTAALLSAQ